LIAILVFLLLVAIVIAQQVLPSLITPWLSEELSNLFDATVEIEEGSLNLLAGSGTLEEVTLVKRIRSDAELRCDIKKLALQRCEKIVCSSRKETLVLQNKFKIPVDRIVHLLNPIDLSKFRKRDKKEAALKLGIDPEYRYLLFVGRMVKLKGVWELLDVFKDLSTEYEDLKLIMIGDGPLMDDIPSFIKNNSMEKKIMIKGRLTHDLLPYYYNIAEALVNPQNSSAGGIGNVTIEAMASEIPVVVTNVDGRDEYISENSGTGILVEPGNKNSLKDGIVRILNNKIKSNKECLQMLNEFSYDNFGQKLLNIYSEVISK